jgi:hypothetical protein
MRRAADSVKRDPQIRRLVWRGYLKLALFLAIIVIGLSPAVFFPGLRGVSIAFIACGTAGIAISVRGRVTRRWSWIASGLFGAWGLATVTIGLLLATGTSPAHVVVQAPLVLSLGIMSVALPRIIGRERTKRNPT